MFFGPAWFCIEPRSHGSTSSSVQQKKHDNVLCSAGIVMFFVLLELLIFCFAAAQQIRNLTLPNIEHGTIHWHRFRKEKNSYFFCIQITTTVKKSNSAAEPHGSPLQGCCTVRPRKGAGQSSIGGWVAEGRGI
jgi:hypothetical protein